MQLLIGLVILVVVVLVVRIPITQAPVESSTPTPSGLSVSGGEILLGATTTLNKRQGGTGLTTYTAGDMIWASSSAQLFEKTAIGSNGQCWQITGTSPATLGWGSCGGTGADTDIPFLTVGNTASLSFERSLLGTANQITATDNGANSSFVFSIPNPFIIPGTASVSTNFEAIGFASASAFKGSAFSGACSGQTALQWAVTGLFTCSGSFQTQDATLTALAALDSTTGFLGETGADTFVRRTLTGTANQIGITNGDSQTGNPIWSITTPFIIPGRASVSSNFEVLGTASVSSTLTIGGTGSSSFAGSLTISKGLTANSYQSGGLTSCSAATKVLRWLSGQFSCGTLAVADTQLTAGTDLTLTTNDLTLDTTLTQAYSFTNAGSQSMTGSLNVSKSITSAKSITGTLFNNTTISSNSFSGSLSGATTGTLSVGTSNNPLKILWSNIIQAVVSFFFPAYTGTSLTGTGSAAVKTASASLDFNDGAVTKILDGRHCFTYVVDAPTASNPGFVGLKRFDNPFTIDTVQPVASGSNAAGWNLKYGVPGTITTSVFAANKSASTSTNPTYTSFTNSTIGDGNVLEVAITSRSAVLQTFSVSVCGRYNH